MHTKKHAWYMHVLDNIAWSVTCMSHAHTISSRVCTPQRGFCMLMRKSHHKLFVSSHLEMMFATIKHSSQAEREVLHPSSSIPFFHFILFPVLWSSFSYSLILLSNTAIPFLFFPFTLFSLVYFAPPPTVRDVLLVWGSVQHHILILLWRN